MFDPLLTAGAGRALEQAARLAAQSGAAEIEPRHLVRALAGEESRAAEILNQHALTSQRLQQLLPVEDRAAAAEMRDVPQSVAVRQVLHEARTQVRQAGRQAEVGTEHLLWGLAVVESDVAQLLHQHGLQPQALDTHVARHSGLTGEPIDVDFSIAWREPAEDAHTDTLRILDAAANRAREGLRVIEDFVRFTLDDAFLSAQLKQCRHDFAAALRAVDAGRLLAARDTLQDVGTSISTPAERHRASPLDVVQANFKRTEEALRTVEEFGKVLAAELGDAAGQVRYRLYTLEKAVLGARLSRKRLDGRDLYLLVTEELCHHGSGPAIREALAAGAGVVQIREKSLSDRQLVEHGRRVREWTREAGALLIMNDRPDLAVVIDADGVHVGQDELSVREARRIVGPDRLVGVSTHSIEQARQAVLDGADYLGVGPVFTSTTKSFDHLAGLEFVRQVAAEITLPWFAIGGITAKNVQQVVAAGARRVAVSAAVCGAKQPGLATQRLLLALHQSAAPPTGLAPVEE